MAELRWLTPAEADGWDEFAGLFTDWCREAIPTERPSHPQEWRAGASHEPAHRRTWQVLAVDGGSPVGAAALGMDGIWRERAWLSFLYVVPERRRRGIGSLVLGATREVARACQRTCIRTSTVVGLPGAAEFVERAGARPGLVVDQNRCPTSGLDREQLRRWCDRAAERAAGYSLVTFDGVCPDEYLDRFVAAMPIMNTAPRTATTEDWAPTRRQVQEMMTALVDQGTEIWTACARDDRSGAFVGYTELLLSPFRPWQAAQGDTGVHPDHRERGLGRWLKAHNALRLLLERPDVEFIETLNASANVPMLSINRAMGFEVVARWQEWDVPVSGP